MFDVFQKMRDPFLRKLGGKVIYVQGGVPVEVQAILDDTTTFFDPNANGAGQSIAATEITLAVSAEDVDFPNTDEFDFDTVEHAGRTYKVSARNDGDVPDASGTWNLTLERLS